MSLLVLLYSFFFFKQKTAYEMRISDWSSDVCSSDLKVVGRRRAPPLRHVDADQAAEMILKWQLALTGHVEARLERPGNDIAKPGRAAIIGQRPKQIEAGDRIVTSTPAFVETGAELGKPADRRSILGFEADDRACWNRRAQGSRSPRPPVVGIGIDEREDHDVERQAGVRCKVQRQNIPALHGELVNQALGQGRPALVRTFPARDRKSTRLTSSH